MKNRCQFIGNLGADVEQRCTPSGDMVASFTVAVSEKWKDKQGNQQENTEWVKCTAFGKLAEICAKYLSKGSKVAVSGKYATNKWKDNEGNTRYNTYIKLQEIEFLSARGDTGREEPPLPTEPFGATGGRSGTGEDVPF
jgi:single-strand DNA-binding protein